jgi:hypothetical protein
MKARLLFVAATLALSAALHASPRLPIDRAAAIAQEQLRERGVSGRVYITSIAMEADSIARRTPYWYARWSEAIPLDERKRELGLRINMDGSLVRMVESATGEGSSAGREALRDHRRRSDRPSILDLKH